MNHFTYQMKNFFFILAHHFIKSQLIVDNSMPVPGVLYFHFGECKHFIVHCVSVTFIKPGTKSFCLFYVERIILENDSHIFIMFARGKSDEKIMSIYVYLLFQFFFSFCPTIYTLFLEESTTKFGIVKIRLTINWQSIRRKKVGKAEATFLFTCFFDI